ncbi:MAG TPA: glycerol kinase GlpK [Lacunisphaera sp.]|jgi:glycerol kinase|nr:glycerol kinase GlpK [Lacunisphaera sp.]
MSQPRYILALDQGTTSSRALVLDRAGETVSSAQAEFPQIYPKPGWVEHDPLEIWASQNATAIEAITKANLSSDAIAAVGLTNQRETTVVWEADTGKPVYNAIVWQDRRTADFCARLKLDGAEPEVTARTGLRLDPYFSGTKIRWILDHVTGARAAADAGRLRFGTVDSWLLWQLTGGKVHVTDVTNASRTLLFNLREGRWDDAMLRLLGVPRSLLPDVRSCSEVYGEVARGLYPAGAPVAGIAGDQHAALFGQACFAPGMAKNTYGTGCFLLMNTGAEAVPSRNNLLTTIAWQIGGRTEYALEGSVFIGGAAVQWLRDELQLVRSAQELDQLAATVPDAGGLFLVPAFAGLGAPHWDPYARGAAVGITRGTNRAHFCRAVLESIALQSADLISCMEKDSGIALQELRVDGGASRSQPLMQFQADLLGTPVVRPRNPETTAMGAAYLAGLAVGYWESRDDIARNWSRDVTFTPARPAGEMQALRAQWERALERAKGWEAGG